MKKSYLTTILVFLLLFILLAGCRPAIHPYRTGDVYIPTQSTPLASLPPVEDTAPVLPTDTGTEQTVNTYPSPDPEMISQQLAMDIALLNAGVSAAEAEFMQVEFDYEGRTPVFEVNFYVGRMEYEYEINANNGSILYFEIDRD